MLYKWFTHGKLERSEGSSITEGSHMFLIWYYIFVIIGIGQGRLTNNLEGAPIDWAVLVKDVDLLKMVEWLSDTRFYFFFSLDILFIT